MRHFFSSLPWMRLALVVAVAGLALALPEVAHAQGQNGLGVQNAFTQVTSQVIKPVVLGARGVGMAIVVVLGLMALVKGIRETSGAEVGKAIGLFFFALVLFNPLLITDTILGLQFGTTLRDYGIQSGFGQ